MIAKPTQISHALCRLAIDQGLVPTAPLAQPIAIGDTTCKVALVNGAPPAWLLPETTFWLWDWTYEIGKRIETVDPDGTIHFNWTGYTADNDLAPHFEVAHAAGAMGTVTLFRHPIDDNNPALDTGFPLIGCYALDDTTSPYANGEDANMSMHSIHYQLSGAQVSSQRLPSQALMSTRMDRAERDIAGLKDTLEKNTRLGVDGGFYAQQILKFITSRRGTMKDPRKPVFDYFFDLHVQGKTTRLRA